MHWQRFAICLQRTAPAGKVMYQSTLVTPIATLFVICNLIHFRLSCAALCLALVESLAITLRLHYKFRR